MAEGVWRTASADPGVELRPPRDGGESASRFFERAGRAYRGAGDDAGVDLAQVQGMRDAPTRNFASGTGEKYALAPGGE
jgi:hypothetical protein